jgi:hypothetical protein
MKRILLVMMFSTMLGTLVWAQSRQVQGRVVSGEDSQPMPGVNILVQGTTKGAVTDATGSFSIELTGSENTLVFSFIGYKPQTVEGQPDAVIHYYGSRCDGIGRDCSGRVWNAT